VLPAVDARGRRSVGNSSAHPCSEPRKFDLLFAKKIFGLRESPALRVRVNLHEIQFCFTFHCTLLRCSVYWVLGYGALQEAVCPRFDERPASKCQVHIAVG